MEIWKKEKHRFPLSLRFSSTVQMAGKADQKKSKSTRRNLVGGIIGTLFHMAQFVGLMQFSYCVKTRRLIDSPRYVFGLIAYSAVYLGLIGYDLSNGESISVAGDQSTLFNTGIAILTSASYLFSLYCLIFTFISRKRLADIITVFIEIEEDVSARFKLIFGFGPIWLETIVITWVQALRWPTMEWSSIRKHQFSATGFSWLPA